MTAAPDILVPNVATGEYMESDRILDLLEEGVERHADIMAAAVAAGDNATAQGSDATFFIGYLACLVHKRYGANKIEEFAKGIRMSVDRVKEYRTVCKYYERSFVAEFRREHPYLTYSHFRRAKRFKDLQKSLAFLKSAERNVWTVEQTTIEAAKALGKEVPPMRKAWEVELMLCMTDNRLMIKVPGISSEMIMELVRDHAHDAEYSATLSLTFAAPPEETHEPK